MNNTTVMMMGVVAIMLLVYGAIAMMIVYHLRTYTINRLMATRATWVFLVVTVTIMMLQVMALMAVTSSVKQQSQQSVQSFGI